MKLSASEDMQTLLTQKWLQITNDLEYILRGMW